MARNSTRDTSWTTPVSPAAIFRLCRNVGSPPVVHWKRSGDEAISDYTSQEPHFDFSVAKRQPIRTDNGMKFKVTKITVIKLDFLMAAISGNEQLIPRCDGSEAMREVFIGHVPGRPFVGQFICLKLHQLQHCLSDLSE